MMKRFLLCMMMVCSLFSVHPVKAENNDSLNTYYENAAKDFSIFANRLYFEGYLKNHDVDEEVYNHYARVEDDWYYHDEEGRIARFWQNVNDQKILFTSSGIRDTDDAIADILSSMSLEEKAGQLFNIRPEDLAYDYQYVSDDTRRVYEEIPVGGFTLFAQNISSPEQTVQMTQDLHALNDIPPLLSIDEEGGIVARIGQNYNFPVTRYNNMGYLSADDAFDAGYTIGSYLKEYGFDLDFAPVADVNTNPYNPIIGTRAFSSDPAIAAQMISDCIQGFHDAGILTCAKHFPGHGDTQTDSHLGYAATYKSWDELIDCEMLPFTAAIEEGTDFIMVAHICAPNVTGDSVPSSLNPVIMDKLRNELGYNGIIITDALGMGAISNYYSSAEASIQALEAGADVLLMPANIYNAYHGVIEAVETGRLSEERIDASVYRILKVKLK